MQKGEGAVSDTEGTVEISKKEKFDRVAYQREYMRKRRKEGEA